MLTQLIFLVLLGLAGWQGLRSYRAWKIKHSAEAYATWKQAQQYTTLKVLVPKNNEKTPLAAEQMFAALHGVYRDSSQFQDEVSFELAAYEKFIRFYVYVPKHLKEFVEGQIYAQYPNVEISEAEDYTALRPQEQVALVGDLTLTKDDVYPIKTFLNFTVDPLSGITAVLGNVAPGEQLWVQMIVKPVPEDWQEKGVEYVSAKRTGTLVTRKGWMRGIVGGFVGFLGVLIRTAFAPATPAESGGESAGSEGSGSRVQLSAPEEAALKGIEEKITKLGFETKIRLLAVARDAYTARSRLESLTGAFKQFNSTNLNGFQMAKFDETPEAVADYITRNFVGVGSILNTEEVASVYHLPAVTVETPNIVWAGSKKGEPPSNLPIKGQADDEDTTFFGTTDFRNFKELFGIKKKDRRLHMYTIGKTGTGKSTLLLNMIIDDIQKGRGVGVVDPHGQLVSDILERIPAHRINDVIYFNPADRDFPIGFNILENVDPDLRSVVSSGVVGVFKKLFAESWGPRLEYILRNAVLALLYYPDTTLLGVNRLLVDDEYRSRVVRKVTDPVVRDFFLEEYDKYDPKFRREAIASIQNKIGQFLSSTTIRNVIGQPKSAFSMRGVMDEGKILLMDLSIGKIGEDSASMLGSMLITKVQLAAMSRADIGEEERRDFYLYVDEFQNFATESFAVMLSEARKYHLNLALTNQFIAQMPEEVAHAVFGNVGTIISFRVGAGDASGLVKEFEPVFEAIDLVNLDNHHIYVKMAIDGVTRPAFSASTLAPMPAISTDHIDKLARVSRERYARPREVVEQKIQEWADDAQVKQAQEWRKRVTEQEAKTKPGGVPEQSSTQPSKAAEFNRPPQGARPATTPIQQSGGGVPRPSQSPRPAQQPNRSDPDVQRSRDPDRERREGGGQPSNRPAPHQMQQNQPIPRPVQPGQGSSGAGKPPISQATHTPSPRPVKVGEAPHGNDAGRGRPTPSIPHKPVPAPNTPKPSQSAQPAAKPLIDVEEIEALRNDAENNAGTHAAVDDLQSLDEL